MKNKIKIDPKWEIDERNYLANRFVIIPPETEEFEHIGNAHLLMGYYMNNHDTADKIAEKLVRILNEQWNKYELDAKNSAKIKRTLPKDAKQEGKLEQCDRKLDDLENERKKLRKRMNEINRRRDMWLALKDNVLFDIDRRARRNKTD